MSRIDETIQAKKDKRQALEAAGVVVHPHSFNKQQTIATSLTMLGQVVVTAGRISSVRAHGQVVFLNITDSTGSIQIMAKKGELAEADYNLLRLLDAGDFLGVEGEVITTKTGEITVLINKFTVLGKALRPMPTEWNKAEDKEVRFRKRYLDMLVNNQARQILDARWLIEKEIRRFLQDEFGFTEVETPILQPLYGGTNAKPFTTHMNALDTDFYLRLAPELYLKRLIVGGYEKIFEIARNFRNEGIDQTHQPEFTMIEWYEAYADYHRMMDVAEGLIKHLVAKLHNSTELQVGEHTVSVAHSWPRITMVEAMQQHLGFDFNALTDEDIKTKLGDLQINLIGEYTRGKAQFALFDKLVPPYLIEPTWIIDYPRDISPLAKHHRLNPNLAERFEGYIGGKELADGWSEIVDPIDQRHIFENEQKRMRAGDDEAHPLDEDFLEAMEYGMPPLGGIGMGIDRLVMFLTNNWSIREVIAFPTLRPLVSESHTNQAKVNIAPVAQTIQPEQTSIILPPRAQAEALLSQHIHNDKLRHHCQMVADAMAAYAKQLNQDEELWYQTGLLHDIDWEEFPDEHPNKAVTEWLGDYPTTLRQAIAAHAPTRTGQQPTTLLDKYLFACDELSGFLHALSLMRPDGFASMKVSSVTKKLKDKSFAANVSREDITQGAQLIQKSLDEHIAFLIQVFST